MARPISLASIIEQGRISSDVALLQALEIVIINQDTGVTVNVIRVVANDEEIVFEGNTYTPTIFDLRFSERSGNVPSASVSINDYKRILRNLEEENGGSIGSTVRVLLLNSADLTTADLDVDFQIKTSSWSSWSITWSLGAPNFLATPFPPRRQYKNRCAAQYKSALCGYSGPLETCDLGLDSPNGCKAHGNELRYVAFPGLQKK